MPRENRAFRWLGPGILRDVVGGRVVVYMGRRTDAGGHALEGEIVRNHTIDSVKLEDWVKGGQAEYVNLVERAVDKLGAKSSDEAEREAEIHTRAAGMVDAALRLQATSQLRTIMGAAVFDDDDRKLAEMELQEVPTASLVEFLASAVAERDRRKAADKPATDAGRAAAEKRILALYDDPVFSDKDRARAEKGIKKIPDDKLAEVESDITAERDRRRAAKAPDDGPDLELEGGAGPAGGK